MTGVSLLSNGFSFDVIIIHRRNSVVGKWRKVLNMMLDALEVLTGLKCLLELIFLVN